MTKFKTSSMKANKKSWWEELKKVKSYFGKITLNNMPNKKIGNLSLICSKVRGL